ncbi:hypothetical protein G7077_13250 [Sphingomonas piscis]|uniref:Spore coat protein U domain-containing protein n=1 Tax=Sphingomonas piscis TaxID=2714943 RepID=A0A6G7YSK6_9SPHN|nr:hypothetical protein [Sphingomonas piscis]QIK79726.1 hypothetical protein G7077_13250 [Sphingomonas piscis]
MVAIPTDGANSIDRDFGARLSSRGRGRWMVRLSALLATVAALCPAPAYAQKAKIDDLTDLSFGTITNLTSDARMSESICVFSQTDNYNVRATGSGTGGLFTLSNGAATLAYEVQWSASSGQTTGTILSPNNALTGQTSTANNQNCNQGPTASLIVVLRSAALSSATAGSYTGTLTLVVAPE